MSKNAISHLKPGFGVKECFSIEKATLPRQCLSRKTVMDELEKPGRQVYLMFSLIEPTRQAK